MEKTAVTVKIFNDEYTQPICRPSGCDYTHPFYAQLSLYN